MFLSNQAIEELRNAPQMYEGGQLEPEIVSTTFKGEDMWQKWTEEEREARKQELLALA